MKKYLFVAMLMAALSSLAFGQIPAGTAWVRVVHISSDAPTVDVLVDGNLALQGLRFKDYSNYTPVPAGNHLIAVNLTGQSTTVLQRSYNLMSGTAYTFYALGRVGAGTLDLMGTGDNVSAPADGSVNVRVVHGASTAPVVDVYVTSPYAPLTGAPVLSGVPFAVGSGYLTVPAGTYQGRVTVAGTKTVAIDSGRLMLRGGTTRTIVAIDPQREGAPFELLVLPDVN